MKSRRVFMSFRPSGMLWLKPASTQVSVPETRAASQYRVCINTRRAPSTGGGAHGPQAIPRFALPPTYVSLFERAPDPVEPMTTRRDFVRTIPMGAVAALSLGSSRTPAALTHPDPRPGIDSSGVLTSDQLAAFPEEITAIYDMVREIPHIADGIGCGCACPVLPNYRSLLTCYHAGGMAMGCPICQSEARLMYRRHKEGQSLAQIRRAIDARYG